MIIQLPLENWADLLPFVPRHQLVDIVKQLGDRQFAKILQFFLTEVGQITLGHLRIVAPRKNDPSPIVQVHKQSRYLETNLPEGSMPTNVKDFKQIVVSYFDESVANFLRQFQQQEQPGNSLLDNVNLWFHSTLSPDDDNTYIPILTKLMPMIGNININSITIWRLHQEFGHSGLEPNNAASQLLTTMLTKARILEIRDYMKKSMFDWCDWLYAPRNDGKPRVLRLVDAFPNTKNLVEKIKKDFSNAIRPVSFFVHLQIFRHENAERQNISLDNGRTNERLVIKTIDRYPLVLVVLISRYSVGANLEWIEANEREIMEWDFHEHNRRIYFEQHLE